MAWSRARWRGSAARLIGTPRSRGPPVHTRPLTLGADIVMHAATRVLNGHVDVVAGALCGREPNAFWERITGLRSRNGAIIGPFEASLLMRGLRTLHVRQERQAASTQTLAERLSAHSNVARVLYPGLPQHPGHDVAAHNLLRPVSPRRARRCAVPRGSMRFG